MSGIFLKNDANKLANNITNNLDSDLPSWVNSVFDQQEGGSSVTSDLVQNITNLSATSVSATSVSNVNEATSTFNQDLNFLSSGRFFYLTGFELC